MTRHGPIEPWRGGRGPKRFAYTYEDLARLFGITAQTVRKWASARRFDPDNLRSVIAVYLERQGIQGAPKR